LPVRQRIRSSALLIAWLFPLCSAAQSTTSLSTDATVLPRGALGIRVLTSFTRWDELLGSGTDAAGTPRNIAATLATNALDATAVPSLAPAEAAIRSLSGLPTFNLSLGNVVAAANARVVTAPLILQYGLTSRLTLGVVVPLVETRTSVFAQLNPKPGFASVGPNPAFFNTTQQASNASLVQTLRSAASALQLRLTNCQATPTDPSCASLLAQRGAVQALIQSTGAFATDVETLYGTGADHPGQPFVPIDTGGAQRNIDQRLAGIRAAYDTLIAAGSVSGTLAGAHGPAATAQFQSLLTALGHDTLGSIDRSSIGDVSVGATLQLLNSYGDTARGADRNPRYRMSVNGAFRFGTGEPASRNRLFDQSTGYGQPGVELGAAGDVRFGRMAATALGAYTLQLGTIDAARVANAGNALLPLLAAPPAGTTYSAGNVLTLSLIPRYTISRYLAVNGEYQIVHTGADEYGSVPAGTLAGLSASTAQQLGFGFSYSTAAAPNRGPGAVPFEVTFSHLETIAGSNGPVPKTFRDQLELRIYLMR
jgi:hypothetical protein